VEDDDVTGILQKLLDLGQAFGQRTDLDDAVGQPELLLERWVLKWMKKL